MKSSFFSVIRFPGSDEPAQNGLDDVQSDIVEKNQHYISVQAGNESGQGYQNAIGAPVESVSPLGYAVGPVTILFLNVSRMIGTGIFSTPSSILNGTGSVGLSLLYWVLGFIMATTAFSVYLEFMSYFPNRSGSEAVYLEQAFPRPRWLFPTAFAFQAVALSFIASNSMVLADYVFKMADYEATSWQQKGTAVAALTLCLAIASINTRFSYWVSNTFGILKVATLVFISITGLVVLGGSTGAKKQTANFDNAFEGHATAYGLTNALYKIVYSYMGFETAFNVAGEVKNPVKHIRRNGYLALWVTVVLYIMTNVAYFAAVSKDDISASKQVVATLFFANVFGSSTVARALNILVIISSFGNMLATLLGTSRIIRECGRQGVLPFPRLWASTQPFGTTLGPYVLKYVISVIMILAPPAGDVFNFLVDLRIIPAAFFDFLMGVGLLIIRRRYKRLGITSPAYRTWDLFVYFNILKNVFLVVMPWIPPEGGIYAGSVSFFYATPAVTSVGILIGCALYHYAWIHALPKLGGYRICQEVLTYENGAESSHLVKVPLSELAAWEATHDSGGRPLDGAESDELSHTPFKG